MQLVRRAIVVISFLAALIVLIAVQGVRAGPPPTSPPRAGAPASTPMPPSQGSRRLEAMPRADASGSIQLLPLVHRVDPTPTSTATAGPTWVTLMAEGFEGDFPAGWDVFDLDGVANGDYRWGKRACRPRTGSYSGWGVGGGVSGSSLTCGSLYPNYTDSWMVFGPFSLEDAAAAELRFYWWVRSETDFDELFWGASIDGYDFFGDGVGGESSSWAEYVFDLSNVFQLGNLLGRPTVWVAFVFSSDEDTQLPEGAYVDDIVLRKLSKSGAVSSARALATPAPKDGAVKIRPAQRSLADGR